ncbi:crossover junction endonuclease EME1 [Pieris rapae]|uniref:crossover junction endonuclease EME1 n=1 Tax=Pieris rapae TaxID=64459 RepID=UPI001E27C1A8|nr:crossover junction endonuclease EME1 [Pieris rapae]
MTSITVDLSEDSDGVEDLPDVFLPSKSSSQSSYVSTSTSKSCSQSSNPSVNSDNEQKKSKKKKVDDNNVVKQTQKIYKPEECMKFMMVEMHPTLIESWYCADVQREVTARGAKINKNSSLCDTRLVLWSRMVDPTFTSNNGMVGLTQTKQPCEHGLYIASLEEIEEQLNTHTLSQHMTQAASLAGCPLTLVLYAVKDYFKPSGRKTNRHIPKIEPIDLEMALTDLLVTAKCDTIKVNTPNELALTIAQFTKAIAEAPYKKAKKAYDEQAEFYMRGDNKKCVTVAKNGDGVDMLWQQMIAVLPHSSLETSRAVCAKYKTLKSLYQALQEPNSVNNVADVGVTRSAAPGSKTRRLGNEFARKLHILFTSEDGNTPVE